MNQGTLSTIERILQENNIPIPEGRGREKIAAIRRLVDTYAMPETVRDRLRNLLSLG